MPCGCKHKKVKKPVKRASGAVKKTKKKVPLNTWRRYVKYLVRKNPGKNLKQLLKGYSKAEYAKFKADPKSFL